MKIFHNQMNNIDVKTHNINKQKRKRQKKLKKLINLRAMQYNAKLTKF